MSETTEAVRALAAMNIDALRVEWRRRFDDPPPAVRAADLLRRCLADRIQRGEMGADAEVERKLRELVRTYRLGRKALSVRPRFRPGTLLEREHNGRIYRVEVLQAGFRYAGRDWKSLSQIAREITGVRWNGPRFFGLREDAT